MDYRIKFTVHMDCHGYSRVNEDIFYALREFKSAFKITCRRVINYYIQSVLLTNYEADAFEGFAVNGYRVSHLLISLEGEVKKSQLTDLN